MHGRIWDYTQGSLCQSELSLAKQRQFGNTYCNLESKFSWGINAISSFIPWKLLNCHQNWPGTQWNESYRCNNKGWLFSHSCLQWCCSRIFFKKKRCLALLCSACAAGGDVAPPTALLLCWCSALLPPSGRRGKKRRLRFKTLFHDSNSKEHFGKAAVEWEAVGEPAGQPVACVASHAVSVHHAFCSTLVGGVLSKA